MRTVGGLALLLTLVLPLGCEQNPDRRAETPPPHRLDRLEATAEDVIDQVGHARWTRIDRDVRAIRRAWQGFAGDARRVSTREAGRVARGLQALTRSVAARDAAGTAQAANDVSAPVVELLGRYALGHPVAIGRLDVIGRQVVFDADRGDFAAAGRQVAAARREWRSVRPSVVAHRGRAVAGRTDGTLERLASAVRGSAVGPTKNDANDLLELVDDMERLY